MTDRLHDAAAWMAQQQSRAATRLQRWCDQNSWSMDPVALQSMADQLCDDFGSFDVEFYQARLPAMQMLGDEESYVDQPTGPALIWHHNPSATQRLLLMIHYDTVYPADSQPDRCRLEGSRLIGPGTADAKGGIAVIAMAVEAMLKFDLAPDLGVSVLLNPDEEVGSTASRELMSRLADQFDAALLFEPPLPDGSLVAARKGSGNFAFVARGRSAHAGRNPDEGRNAIVQLCKLIPRLTSLHDPANGALVNIGRIAGGEALNRVPDHAVLQLNARVDNDDTLARIGTALRELADEFTGEDYRVSVQGSFTSPPKLIDDQMVALQNQIESAGQIAGRTILWQDTGGACDGSKLAAFGLPNIDSLGIAGGNLHSPTEFADLTSLVPAAHTIAAFIDQWNDDA